MSWTLDFISQQDFEAHVQNTIAHYGNKLESYDVKKFNRNLIDPVKMVFDKAIYGETWEEIVSNEIFRQRDKSSTNEIGYFHQKIFQYIAHCHVPPNGKEGGWDVIYTAPRGYDLPNGNKISRIYVEMKNKHNTMNSSAAGKTYIKMQNQLLKDDDCACFLVEAIAKQSQNIVWKTKVDGQNVSHDRIRRVSLDQFYTIVTGEPDAFFQMCMELPRTVQTVLESHSDGNEIPQDTVYSELQRQAQQIQDMNGIDQDTAMLLSMYLLGFSSYSGFERIG